MRHRGTTYDPALDEKRLDTQFGRVWDILVGEFGSRYLTLDEIQSRLWNRFGKGAQPTAIAARFREISRPEFGAYATDRRRRSDPKRGLWEYAIVGGAGSAAPKVRKHCLCCPNHPENVNPPAPGKFGRGAAACG